MPTTKHILLVDDDSSIRATLKTCLEASGYFCMEAKDGQEACEKLENGHSVDLIITDHHMPRVVGLELINILKSQRNSARIPIIFYSGQLTTDLRTQALQAGASAVLEKPFKLPELLDLVTRV